MATLLKSLQLPGLSDTYIIGDTNLNTSGAAADSATVGAKFAALPQILDGTVAPASATGTLKTKLSSAPNGSIYIMHS